MKNFIHPGCIIALIAPYAVASGAGLLVGAIFGVATNAAANGAEVEAQTTGVFDLPKAAGVVAQGALIYWDNAAKVVTTAAAAGANKLIGTATAAAQAGDATARVRLNGAFIS